MKLKLSINKKTLIGVLLLTLLANVYINYKGRYSKIIEPFSQPDLHYRIFKDTIGTSALLISIPKTYEDAKKFYLNGSIHEAYKKLDANTKGAIIASNQVDAYVFFKNSLFLIQQTNSSDTALQESFLSINQYSEMICYLEKKISISILSLLAIVFSAALGIFHRRLLNKFAIISYLLAVVTVIVFNFYFIVLESGYVYQLKQVILNR